MKEDNVAIRLKYFIDNMQLSYSQFADQCGIARPSISHLLAGRNKKISDVIVGQIHAAFPRLSVLWLLFGEGPMLLPEERNDVESGELPNLFSDSEKFAYDSSDEKKYSNLNALNSGVNSGQSSVNPEDNEDKIYADLKKQIDNLRKNPRKVVQITVYYDDSTFETFIPG